MKLRRCCLVNDGRLAWKIPDDEGSFVFASDAEALEQENERLWAALRDVSLMPCDCFRNSGCGSCLAREKLKALEAKG
jgi:hypothetical protein